MKNGLTFGSKGNDDQWLATRGRSVEDELELARILIFFGRRLMRTEEAKSVDSMATTTVEQLEPKQDERR